MKSKVKKLKGTRRRLDIEMSKDKVDLVFEQVFKDLRKNADIPGFRAGRVPMEMIKKRYGEQARSEVKKRAIPRAYQHALEEHELEPVSYPDISEVMLSPSGALKFSAQVDIEPDFELKEYKGIKVKKDVREVTEEEVEKALERIKNMNPEFEDIKGALKKGDYAVCDVETFSDGQAISEKRKDMWIEVDKEASMLGMGEELEGLEKGAFKEVEATLPESYPDEKYAGKEVVFKVFIKETKKKKLLPEGKELAEKTGKSDMKELREEIRSQLTDRKEISSKVELKEQLLEYLLKKHSFDVPESMVERQQNVLMQRAEDELARKGVSGEALQEHKEKIEKKIEEEAEKKVRLYFILRGISEREDIEIFPEEIEGWLKKLGESYGQTLESVKKYYQENNLMAGLNEQLKEEKTIEFLLDQAQVQEK